MTFNNIFNLIIKHLRKIVVVMNISAMIIIITKMLLPTYSNTEYIHIILISICGITIICGCLTGIGVLTLMHRNFKLEREKLNEQKNTI